MPKADVETKTVVMTRLAPVAESFARRAASVQTAIDEIDSATKQLLDSFRDLGVSSTRPSIFEYLRKETLAIREHARRTEKLGRAIPKIFKSIGQDLLNPEGIDENALTHNVKALARAMDSFDRGLRESGERMQALNGTMLNTIMNQYRELEKLALPPGTPVKERRAREATLKRLRKVNKLAKQLVFQNARKSKKP